jgi:hypothetical protein
MAALRGDISCRYLKQFFLVYPTILKGDHPRTIPAKFVLIWFSCFRGEDLNQFIPFRNIMR